MGYSISIVQHNKTHFHGHCSSHLFFVDIQSFDARKSVGITKNVYSYNPGTFMQNV
jgi:hypothetical protein